MNVGGPLGGEDATAPRRSALLIRAAEFSLPTLLIVVAVVALVYAVAAIGFKWELYPGEAQNAYFADRLGNHGDLYTAWSDEKLLFPIYAPLYYVTVAPLSWIAGTEIWGGRLVSLLSFGFTAVAAGLTARRLGASQPESVASALALITVPSGALITFNARPDTLALALTAAALLAATVWEDTRSTRSLLGAGAASVALVFTRQNYAPIVLAIAIGLYLRDRQAATRFAFSVTGASLGLVALINLLTDGAFISNNQDFNAIGYSVDYLRMVIDLVTLPFPNPIFVVAGIEAIIALLAWRTARTAAWAWLGGLLVFLTAVRIGASDNYVLALGLTSSILLGPALAHARRVAGRGMAAAVGAALALLLLPHAVSVVRQLHGSIDGLGHLDRIYGGAIDHIEATPGEMFGDRLDVSLASGNPPGLDPFNHTKLAEAGVWDPNPLAERIRRQEFGAIQTGFDAQAAEVWAPPLVEAIRSSYCPTFSLLLAPPHGGIYIYEPCLRPSPSRGQP